MVPLTTEGKAVPTLPIFGDTYHVKGKTCEDLQIKPLFVITFLSWVLRGLTFHITGVISLPYAEIQEPFEAWFHLKAKSSRIDYYHGKNPPRGKELTGHLFLLRRMCDVKLRVCCSKKKTCQSSLHNEKKKREHTYKTWFLLQYHILALLPFSLNWEEMSVQRAKVHF